MINTNTIKIIVKNLFELDFSFNYLLFLHISNSIYDNPKDLQYLLSYYNFDVTKRNGDVVALKTLCPECRRSSKIGVY